MDAGTLLLWSVVAALATGLGAALGVSILGCALWSVFSSLPQPLMAVPAFLLVDRVQAALPYGLGFAAGAMVYMVLIELLPEAYDAAERRSIAVLAGLTTVVMLLFQQVL